MKCPRCFTEVLGDEEKCRKCGYLITGYSRDYSNPYEFRDKDWDPYIGILHPMEVTEDEPEEPTNKNGSGDTSNNEAEAGSLKSGGAAENTSKDSGILISDERAETISSGSTSDSGSDSPSVSGISTNDTSNKKKHHFVRNLIILFLLLFAAYAGLYYTGTIDEISFLKELNLPELPDISGNNLSSASQEGTAEGTGVVEEFAGSEAAVGPEINKTDNVQEISVESRIDLSEIQANASSNNKSTSSGKTYEKENAFDGDETTNWQEGSPTEGIGEWISADFLKPEKIKYITFRMGSWESAEKYAQNCRPQHVRIYLDNYSYDLEFEDEKKEVAFEVVPPCEITQFRLEIIDVVRGDKYANDTAIADISFYRE